MNTKKHNGTSVMSDFFQSHSRHVTDPRLLVSFHRDGEHDAAQTIVTSLGAQVVGRAAIEIRVGQRFNHLLPAFAYHPPPPAHCRKPKISGK